MMRIDATPTMIFMNKEGELLGRYRGFLDKKELQQLLIYVGEGYIDNMDFDEFKNRH